MSGSDRDVTRIVRSWLDEGATALPDRVLDAVLDELPATHQRRPWWPAWRLPYMNQAVRLGIAAAVVTIAAVLGFNYLVAPNIGGPGLDDSPPTPTPTVEPTATSVPALGSRDSLDARRYRVVNAGLSTDVTVAVPAGWSSSGNWVAIGPRGNDMPDGMAIRFYTIQNLAANPLSYDEGNLEPPVGPTVDDLVQAIVTHPAWTATEATDITIDGRPGQLVSITIPVDAPLPDDSDGEFYLYADPYGGGIYGWAPGQTFDWYIVDVDGERLIIDAFHYPGTSEQDLAAQRAVVESVELGPNP